uniref:DMT family transporter n=1 Tax=uncultured Sphingomonas sp. TaxID=158754 RepID=UPI0025EC504C|nr:multidrug efflux SMR transporter [uncultured Sphingomonas sp.]
MTTTLAQSPPAQSRIKAWMLLLLAAGLEIIFALATGASEGFSVLWPSIISIVAVAGSIYFLTQALKTLDVGVGYTVWTGIGSVGTVLLGVVILGESLSLAEIACFALIIGGVIGLQQSDRKPKADELPGKAAPLSVAVRCGGTASQPASMVSQTR